MGKLRQGILGGVSGKVGNVIGASWKGIATIKAMPMSVANPKTAAQVKQREQMKGIVAVATFLLAAVIKPLWDRTSVKMSGYNSFVKANISTFRNLVFTDFDLFIISTGKIAASVYGDITASIAAGTCVVDWVDDSGEGFKLATDDAYVVLCDSAQNTWSYSAAAVKRSALSCTVQLPEGTEDGDQLHVYLAFRRADGLYTSKTVYEQVIVQA